MPKPTLLFAALLIALGVGAFFSSGSRTALLPAYAGIVLATLAVLALAFDGGRRHLMHVAAVVVLLGALAPAATLGIQIEHNAYYSRAPIFILKPTSPHEVLEELEAHVRQGDVFFVHYEQKEPCAYMIVGNSSLDGEGFLLQNTKTAQIKSAYARPGNRSKGIGKALLQRAIAWLQANGYERIFVEHETANFSGSIFWQKHFNPYIYFSMRYIDNTI